MQAPLLSPAPAAALPTSRVRAFARTSADAWKAVLDVAADQGFVVYADKKNQLLSSGWRMLLTEEVEIHAYVPKEIEPARVWVDAVAMTPRRRGITEVRLRYMALDVSGRFLDGLERRLGVPGHPVPVNWEERLSQARALGGQPCLAPDAASGALTLPPRKLSGPDAYYPAIDRKKGRHAVIPVEVSLGEDGAVLSARARAGPGEERMAGMAEGAVHMWRFAPARRGLCGVPSVLDVTVEF